MAIDLKYPLEDDDYKARVSFKCYTERRPPITAQALNLVDQFNVTQALENITGGNQQKEAASSAAQAQDTPNDFKTIKKDRPFKSPVGYIKMYMPQQIQFADRAEYTNVDLGIVGAGVSSGIRNSQSGIELAKDIFKSSLPSATAVKDLAARGLQSEAAQIAALRLSRFSEGIQGAIETETGLTINPNRRTTFRGVGLRRFNFNFAMVPTSEREAEEIKKIVGFFREQVYPELTAIIPGTQNALSAGLRFPNKFELKLQYLIDGIYQNILGHILPCFLENVSVTYNPNAMAFHNDGNPQETQISLSFIEERALNKDDVRKENREFFGGFSGAVNTSLRPRARPVTSQTS